MPGNYTPPTFSEKAFNCPYCGAYAHQLWFDLFAQGGGIMEGFSASRCQKCEKWAVWFDKNIIYPTASIAPFPADDMPEDVKTDFTEARNIANTSPRGAAALLRLALQKLMLELGEKGDNLNTDIANLVKKGLPQKMQQALDAVRVIGNNAVHPGQLDLRDDVDTAVALFQLLNMVVEVMITQPNKVSDIYTKIPQSTLDAIQKRDSP